MDAPAFRHALLTWYDHSHRQLPWRESADFYRVWLSEIMLQQTRVETVLPYYQRFLDRFPSLEDLAHAPEPDVLTAWSGLGYYRRARNLHAAAKLLAQRPRPRSHQEILALPGIGAYTAAAIGSIAFGLPHAAVDGNVIRVLARLTNNPEEVSQPSTRRVLDAEAARLLDPLRPGDYNQAMMELGATVCTPRAPACPRCPVEHLCAARAAGLERQLPLKRKPAAANHLALDLLLLEHRQRVFLVQRGPQENRLAGFWELPEKSSFPRLRGTKWREFTHQIVNDRFHITIWKSQPRALPKSTSPGAWFPPDELHNLPITTVTRKALQP